MRTRLHKTAVLLLALLLLLVNPLGFGAGTAAGAEAVVQDGTYSNIFYRYLKDNSSADSAAHVFLYTENSGKLTVKDGQAVFEHEVASANYTLIPYIGFRKPGAAKAVINGSDVQGKGGYQPYQVDNTGSSGGRVRISLELEDLRQPTDILMHVIIQNHPDYPGLDYDYWYNAQLWLDTSSLPVDPGEEEDPGGEEGPPPVTLAELQDLITVSRAVYDNTVEGSEFGQYPAGSRAVLYDHILGAEVVAQQSEPEAESIKSAFDQLNAGLAVYKASVYSADKEALRAIVVQTEELLSGLKEVGTAEGKGGYIFAPVSAGEYMRGVSSSLNGTILRTAQTVLANDSATQAQVDASVKALTTRYTNNKDRYYVATEPEAIHVVDTLEPTDALSMYAADFGGTAVLLKNQWNEYNDKVHANLPFLNKQVSEVVQSVPAFGGDFSTDGLDYAQEQYRAIALKNGSSDAQTFYQVAIRNVMGTAAAGANWLGLSYVRYKAGNEIREVYISYNTQLLADLDISVTGAQQKLQNALAPEGAEEVYAEARERVGQAVQTASDTAANLAATRPQIAAADQELQAALSEWEQNVVVPLNVSVADGEKDSFAPAASYFRNPALIATVAGDTYAVITADQAVTELRVNTGGQFHAAEVLAETAQGTRVFKVAPVGLAGLTSAQVLAGGTVYPVRLNFGPADNSRLAAAVHEAEQVYAAAVTGTEPGQYPAEAKTALSAAIGEAHKAAVDLGGSQQKSDALLAVLTEALKSLQASVVPESEEGGETPGTGPNPGTGTDPGTGTNPGSNSPSGLAGSVASSGTVTGTIVGTGGTTDIVTSDPGSNPGDSATGGQTSFSDVQGHWAQEAIREAVTRGIAKGYEDGRFRPEGIVTRAEFAVFLSRALELETLTASAPVFSDQAKIPAWASEAVATLSGAGLLNGYADGTFGASGTITRAEMAVIAARALKLPAEAQPQLAFADAASIPAWARGELAAATRAGLMQGKAGNRFDPLAHTTRAEAVTLIIRLLGNQQP